MKRKYIIWTIVLICTVLAAILLPYIIKFRNSPISTDTTKWGAFGDYISGLLSIPISIATLVVTIVIAVLIEKYNDERSKKSLEHDKQRFLNELRFQQYQLIANILAKVPNFIIEKKPHEIAMTVVNLQGFRTSAKFLFPVVSTPAYEELIDSLDKMHDITYAAVKENRALAKWETDMNVFLDKQEIVLVKMQKTIFP